MTQLLVKLYFKTVRNYSASASKNSTKNFSTLNYLKQKIFSTDKQVKFDKKIREALSLHFNSKSIANMFVSFRMIFRLFFNQHSIFNFRYSSLKGIDEYKDWEKNVRSDPSFPENYHNLFASCNENTSVLHESEFLNNLEIVQNVLKNEKLSLGFLLTRFRKMTTELKVCCFSICDLFTLTECSDSVFILYLFVWKMLATAFRGETHSDLKSKFDYNLVKVGDFIRIE